MHCTKCGEESPSRFKFCPLCGEPLDPMVTPKPMPSLALTLREQLNRLDDIQIEALALDTFPSVYDKFSRGLRRDEKVNLLLEHCRFNPEAPLILSKKLNNIAQCVNPVDTLEYYLYYVIESNRRLPLQGIRSSSGLVSIELEQIYVTLTAVVRKTVTEVEDWLAMEARIAPSEIRHKNDQKVKVKVQEALSLYPRLVVLGDPGSGKTTLLRYLALTYARDYQAGGFVQKRLGLNEQRLPIFLPLRDFARNLEEGRPDNGADGPRLLMDYLQIYFENQQIILPTDFLSERLKAGECLVLFDGMDEVAGMTTRQRVARIVERFTVVYPKNRYIVTSRIVGYTSGARLGENYEITTIRDFTDDDIACFVRYWNRAIEVTLAGEATAYALHEAEKQTQSLLNAIKGNKRVQELAVNPLLLTVIALVHRYRAQLPERRVELYEEALEVLLAQWDEVKGLSATTVLQGLRLDSGDRRGLLEPVALEMMERRIKEIDLDDLRKQLTPVFLDLLKDSRKAAKAVDGFIKLINERSGLLTERGQGQFGFSHLTFQEYLAARVIADRKDYLKYTLKRVEDSWWREVVLLEVGYLGKQGKQRANELIRAIMNQPKEPEPFYNLILAAEAIRDIGPVYVDIELQKEIQQRLRDEFKRPLSTRGLEGMFSTLGVQPKITDLVQRRAAAAEALGRIENGGFITQPAFWKLPYGEPVWIEIPAGDFWMGSKRFEAEKPLHRNFLEPYSISKTPITNAQYRIFVEATRYKIPIGWDQGTPPKKKENHPVTNISYYDALAYCEWLSKVTRKKIALPSEAEWEKAARGNQDQREYPWGTWREGFANTEEIGLDDTTPVGIFPDGASQFGVLDMVGNIWEWTNSMWTPYINKGKLDDLDLKNDDKNLLVLRGGAFLTNRSRARCAFRGRSASGNYNRSIGIRLVLHHS